MNAAQDAGINHAVSNLIECGVRLDCTGCGGADQLHDDARVPAVAVVMIVMVIVAVIGRHPRCRRGGPWAVR